MRTLRLRTFLTTALQRMRRILTLRGLMLWGLMSVPSGCAIDAPAEAELLRIHVTLSPPASLPSLLLSGAPVRLRSLETGVEDTAYTNSSGIAVFPPKPPGRFDIRTRASGRNGAIFDTLLRRPAEAALLLKLL